MDGLVSFVFEVNSKFRIERLFFGGWFCGWRIAGCICLRFVIGRIFSGRRVVGVVRIGVDFDFFLGWFYFYLDILKFGL